MKIKNHEVAKGRGFFVFYQGVPNALQSCDQVLPDQRAVSTTL